MRLFPFVVDVQRGEAREAPSARASGFQGGDQVLASDAKARYVKLER